ncbi:MarR family winged helix-turn-helix transcriptional regulator [Romboutsia ilealis]|uniref:MarR family winged helix-turn-helix transcriptional regulator n=1 Tax=Romboutsia ilealis TaxID=1115758 RepID=UPI0025736901|nr:MarR family transcriptional regulator [Romboutsia ilealis]
MDEIKLEAIIQNFISIIPLFKKKLLHDNCKFDKGNLNHSHFQILAVLKKEGQQPISEVAKKLFISTPNMTKLLNKLIDEDMIERIPGEKDRRVININLTEKGNIFLEDKFLEFESSLKNKFSPLSQDKLDKLNDSLITLKEVLNGISSDL